MFVIASAVVAGWAGYRAGHEAGLPPYKEERLTTRFINPATGARCKLITTTDGKGGISFDTFCLR